MFALPLATLAAIYVFVFLGGILLVILALRLRTNRHRPTADPRILCAVCAMSYRPDGPICPCPRCGSLNSAPAQRPTRHKRIAGTEKSR